MAGNPVQRRFFHAEVDNNGFAYAVSLHQALARALDALHTGTQWVRVLVTVDPGAWQSVQTTDEIREGVELFCGSHAMVGDVKAHVYGVIAIDLAARLAEETFRPGHGGSC